MMLRLPNSFYTEHSMGLVLFGGTLGNTSRSGLNSTVTHCIGWMLICIITGTLLQEPIPVSMFSPQKVKVYLYSQQDAGIRFPSQLPNRPPPPQTQM